MRLIATVSVGAVLLSLPLSGCKGGEEAVKVIEWSMRAVLHWLGFHGQHQPDDTKVKINGTEIDTRNADWNGVGPKRACSQLSYDDCDKNRA
jgi:hypothetical protein